MRVKQQKITILNKPKKLMIKFKKNKIKPMMKNKNQKKMII